MKDNIYSIIFQNLVLEDNRINGRREVWEKTILGGILYFLLHGFGTNGFLFLQLKPLSESIKLCLETDFLRLWLELFDLDLHAQPPPSD